MKLNRKIKAFTLTEMLVVLVISSIVISLTFVVLSMVQTQIRSIHKNTQNKENLQLLERLLWQDFNRYQVKYNTEKETLYLANSIDSFKYEFHLDYVLRKMDTIKIKILTKQFFLDGAIVPNGALDAIAIETQIPNKHKMFIFKNKSATHYLNN